MISSRQFTELLISKGYNFFSGVPCSVYRAIIPYIENYKSVIYTPTPREDISVALSAGAYLGGKKPAVLIQNTGLGNCLDALIGIHENYKLPLLMIISWRGYKKNDERQHWLWAEYQNSLLKSIKIPKVILDKKNPEKKIAEAHDISQRLQCPVALIVIRGYINENE